MMVGTYGNCGCQEQEIRVFDIHGRSTVRLTLRTLLAYLDDILEPAQAKEIGTKISESSFASTLVNRIREVMRRRRLTTPELSGSKSGLEPNVVAEYLDNTLPPESVPDVEKVYLESDVHLAEVAACHQILTLVLGEPVEVSQASRERMYALGPVTKRQTVTVDSSVVTGTTSRAAVSDELDETLTIPDYLKPVSLWRRALPYGVVTIVVSVWLGLFVLEPLDFASFVGSQAYEVDSRNQIREVQVTAIAQNSKHVDATASSQLTSFDLRPAITESPKQVMTINKPAVITSTKQDAAEEPTIKIVIPFKAPDAKATDVDVAVVDPASFQVKPGAKEPLSQSFKETRLAIPDAVAPEIQYTSSDGILLRYDEGRKDWMVMPYRSAVYLNELLASPEPFKASLSVGQELCTVTLLGSTSVRMLRPNNLASFGFEIKQGRVVLQTALANSQNADEQQVVLAVKVHGELWNLVLAAGTVCGIEIDRREPEKFEGDFGKNAYTGGVYVVEGTVRFNDEMGHEETINTQGWLSLTPKDRMEAHDSENPIRRPPLLKIPYWLNPNAKPTSSTPRRYRKLFEKEFDPEQPILLSVPTIVKSSRTSISELAVKCLALTGNYAPLVEILAQADRYKKMTRQATLIGLRKWLPTSENNKILLKDALRKSFYQDDVDVVYQLLWGYNEQDAQNRFVSQQLVEWLDHDQIVVRELAFYHVFRLTGQRYNYRSDGASAQREVAINRWRRHLEKRKGTLLD